MQTKALIAFLLTCVVFNNICQAKVWKINLSSNYNGKTLWGEHLGGNSQTPVFKNLQQAVDFSKVMPGDTIHVAFVNASYGSVVISKRLVIIGDAYPYTLPTVSRNANIATNVSGVSFLPGSEGSQFLGFRVKGEKLKVDTENITIRYCVIEGALDFSSRASGATISYNFFKKTSQRSVIDAESGFETSVRNVVFNNNILQKPLLTNNVIFKEVKNNIIDAPSPVMGGNAVQIRTENYTNNILKTPNARVDVTREKNARRNIVAINSERERNKNASVAARGQDCTEPPAQPAFIPDMETCNTTIVVEIDEVEGATSYTWDAPMAVITSGQGTNAITLQIDPGFWEPTVHTISVVSENECGQSEPRTFTISALPVVDLEAVLIATFEETCEGFVTGFVAIPNVAETYANYQWRHNITDVGTNSYFYEAPVSDGDLIYCMVNANVCGIGTTSTNGIEMHTWPTFTPSVEIVASSTDICPGQLVSFSAIPTAPGDFPMYEWIVNGNSAAIGSSEFSTTTLQDGDRVSVMMISSELCVSSGSVFSTTLTITVNPVTTPTVSISASATEFCAGTNVTFTATATNGGTTPQYQWKVNGESVGTNQATFSIGALSDGDEVSCEMISNAACASGTPVSSSTIQVSVIPEPTPAISITASVNNVCAGQQITFTAQVTDGGTSPTYKWKVNNVVVGTNQSTYSSNTFSDGDRVVCDLISNAPCASTSTVSSDTATVEVMDDVVGSISIAGETTVIVGDDALLTSQITGVTGSYIQQWQDSTSVHGWQDIPGATAATLNYSPATTGDKVRCVLTSTSLCGNLVETFSNKLEFTVNIPRNIFRSYPNPTDGLLRIDRLSPDDHWKALEIININGHRVSAPIGIAGQTSIAIDIRHLTPGEYIIRLTRDTGSAESIKIIKR